MPRRADVLVAQAGSTSQFTGAGTQYLVRAENGALYFFYVDTASDLAFKKSTDGGVTWSTATVIFTGTIVSFAVWYDRWSGISADLIHLAYTESGTSDTLYRTVNTGSSDALSTQTVIFAGTSTAANGHLSITRARGGNVYCKTVIDNGAEGGFFRLPNANVPNGAWDAARTIDEALAGSDKIILVPGFAADDQDIMAIFWDSSASEVSRKIHDDSANSWAETSIATSMTSAAASSSFPHFAAAVDLTNSRIVMVAWSAVDLVNADLRCWTVTESTITEVTNVVLNSSEDQGLCGISIDLDSGDWFVFYGGASDGSGSFLNTIGVYMKGSTDDGSTWSPETQMSLATDIDVAWLVTDPRHRGYPVVAYHKDTPTIDEMFVNVDRTQPVSQIRVGI